MNISDYIKDMRAMAEASGITDAAEMNETLTLALFKLLNSPATALDFKYYSLNHNNKEGETFRITSTNFFVLDHFSLNETDNVNVYESTFGVESEGGEIKEDSLKAIELKVLKLVQDSETFNDFCEKYSKLIENNEIKSHFSSYSWSSPTLINAYKMLNDVKNNNFDSNYMKVSPFAELSNNNVMPEFIKLATKDIVDKLDYLETKETLFQTLSSVDGINYTSFKRFKEAYYANELESDSILAKLLSSDNPADCVESIFEGEWFDTEKENLMRTLKIQLLRPTMNELYQKYPAIDSIVDAIHDKYPYFKINQNDTLQIKTLIETNDTTNAEIESNRKAFLDDVNLFRLDNKDTDKNRETDMKYTRVYAASPFGVLMDIGGRQQFPDNKNISILYLDEINLHTAINDLDRIISDENELICINRFLKMCEDNKIICAYDGKKVSLLFKKVISEHKGVVSFDRNIGNSEKNDALLPYRVMLKDMSVTYSEFSMLQKEIPNLPKDSSKDDILKFFDSKLKSSNKLTL
jgi:hypothetical protein